MKRISPLLVSLAFLLQAPSALAAYDSPADLLKAFQTDATPRTVNVETHVSYTAEDPFYVSLWVRGRTQGKLAEAQGETSATLDFVMPSEDVHARIKARTRVTDKTFYGLLESMSGKLGTDEEGIKASLQEVLGKWVSMKIDPSVAKDSGIDFAELFNEDMLRMERTQGKDGSMYSITVDRDILRGFLSLASSFDPSLETASPAFNFHAVVITDHEERVKNARIYLSLQIPNVSFVFQASSEALPTGFKVRAPANAIPMDAMVPSFSEGEWSSVPADPRASGTDKYDARAAARALRQKSVKKPVSSKIQADVLSFGEESAPVTITEYTDYECPFCSRFHSSTYLDIWGDYIKTGKVRFVIKQYPLSQIHSNALIAAMAVQCSLDQGIVSARRISDAMWTLHEGGEFDEAHIREYATVFQDSDEAGKEVTDCIDQGAKQDVIDRHIAEGDKEGVTGTPFFVLTNTRGGKSTISGAMPYETFRMEIDALLK